MINLFGGHLMISQIITYNQKYSFDTYTLTWSPLK